MRKTSLLFFLAFGWIAACGGADEPAAEEPAAEEGAAEEEGDAGEADEADEGGEEAAEGDGEADADAVCCQTIEAGAQKFENMGKQACADAKGKEAAADKCGDGEEEAADDGGDKEEAAPAQPTKRKKVSKPN
jgi:hypothetical protein